MNWNVKVGNSRQTSSFVPSADWPAYRTALVADRAAGLVIGWTTIPCEGGMNVICTRRQDRFDAEEQVRKNVGYEE